MKSAITGNLIKFTFDNNVPPLTFDATKASNGNAVNAKMYGFNVRLVRMAAIPRAGKDGVVVTVTEQMRHDAVAEGIGHYESDSVNWEMRTAARPAINPLWAQIAEKRGITYEAYCAERVAKDLAELESLA